MENKFWNMMDQFFILLILLTGEEKAEEVRIHHIL